MADLPSGTVTLLFTDIAGSTQLLRRLGDAYAGVLAAHQRLLREAFAAHDGHEVDTQGDAFFVAFPRAVDAVAAAVAAQRARSTYPWPDSAAVRVRNGSRASTIRTATGTGAAGAWGWPAAGGWWRGTAARSAPSAPRAAGRVARCTCPSSRRIRQRRLQPPEGARRCRPGLPAEEPSAPP
jgi:hypothetical protein